MTLYSLEMFLYSCGLPVADWGKGKAKKVEDLLNEIRQGECYLRIDEGGISRFTEIVSANILSEKNPDWGNIVEVGENLPDGRYRQTNQLPGGKICKNESPEIAFMREIQEELGFKPVILQSSKMYQEKRTSLSYPGLFSFYNVHQFDIYKPDGMFEEKQFETIEEDGTRHFFRWDGR